MPVMQILAHGVDAVEIPRIARMLETHGERFVQRCFTPAERRYADAATPARRYAARFAGKEAVLKALGTGLAGGITWLDVEISRAATGQPGVVLTGRCAQIARELGVVRWHVSLSHTRNTALASVIGCG